MGSLNGVTEWGQSKITLYSFALNGVRVKLPCTRLDGLENGGGIFTLTPIEATPIEATLNPK